MNKSKFAALLVAVAGFALALPAAAQTSFYFGGSLSKAESKDTACFQPSPPFGCDRKGEIAWSAFAGVMANRYFGIEAGYHNLGKIVEVADDTTGHRGWVRTNLGELVAIAAFPIGDSFAIYAKGGGYYAKSTLTASFAPSAESTTKQWTFGAGGSWDVFKNVGLRAEYQRYNNVGGQEIGFRTDVDVMSLGAYLKF